MINLALRRVASSTITLRDLYDIALPAVVHEVEAGGYMFDEGESLATQTEHGWVRELSIDSETATLTAAANEDDNHGTVKFILRGDRFGQQCDGHETDMELWARLDELGSRLAQEYTLAYAIGDPDLVLPDEA